MLNGYEGFYWVSNYGRIKNRFDKILKRRISVWGYDRVALQRNCTRRDLFVHRLVAEAFIPNPENKPTVNHIDENKLNNCVWNLEWATKKEQINHGTCRERMGNKNAPSYAICGVHVETNEVITFKSISEAGRNGFDFRTIQKCLKGKVKTHKKYEWKYLNT